MNAETTALARLTIMRQIDALEKMAERIDHEFQKAIDIILGRRGRLVVMGMGKSGIMGRKISATLASTDTPSFSVHPGEAFHGDLGMIHPDNAVLDVSVEREACRNNLAPTSSTTATVVMGDALASVLMELRGFQPEDCARFHPGGRRLLTRVCDVMHREKLPFCQLDASFIEIVHTITRGCLGLSLVMDGDRLAGLITDGDLRRALEGAQDHRLLCARDIMTRNPKTARPEERFAEAESRMRALKINSLVVLDDRERVTGVLQIYDIASDVP